MFSKLSLIALVAPIVSGLVLQVPQNPTSGGSVTIKWTNQQGDPETWSFELTNEIFHNAFAIKNNVDPSLNELTLTLPVVPVGDGYTLQAVNIGNIDDVFASTGSFSIGATTSSSSSSGSSTSSSTSSTKTSTTSSTSSKTSVTSTTSSTTFTSLTVTSSTPTASSSTGTVNATSTNAAAITPFSAASSRANLGGSFGGFAVAVLSAVAGVVMVSL